MDDFQSKRADPAKGLIQVAGVHDMDEARMLLDAGVDLIGIPLRLTVNDEDLEESAAADISKLLPRQCCLITYLNGIDDIVQLTEYLQVSYVQLHGPVDSTIMPELNRRLPDVCFIKSLIIGKEDPEELLTTINCFSPYVWAFITDSFDPATGAEGATGRVHDWDISRLLVESSERPLILAGGLHAGNVAEAIRHVRPFGVDVHTGVESANGRKDHDRVHTFVLAAKSAFSGQYKL